jgi:hypothetical protein
MDDGTDGGMDGKLHFVTTSTKKAAVSDSVEGWCAAGNLGASRVSIRMDN